MYNLERKRLGAMVFLGPIMIYGPMLGLIKIITQAGHLHSMIVM